MIHNESGNIWTHILGFTLLLFLMFEGISYELEKNHVIGRNFVNGFILPYIKCKNNQPFNKNSALVSDVHENIFKWMNLGEQNSEYFNENIPTWPIMVMLLGIAFALACSVVYHTFHPLNKSKKQYIQNFAKFCWNQILLESEPAQVSDQSLCFTTIFTILRLLD